MLRYTPLSHLRLYLFAAASLLASGINHAQAVSQPLELGTPFLDNMILQRGVDVPVWGWANAGTEVTVTFDGMTRTAIANEKEQWSLSLPAQPTVIRDTAAEPGQLVAGKPAQPTVEKIEIAGATLTLKVPVQAAPGKPWLWMGEFGGHLKKLEAALVDKGWHVAYLPFSNKFGSPEEMALWEQAYQELHDKRGLAARPALLGISRGGLYVNAWTRLHPDRVSVLYLDNGVCDPRSWPGGFELSTQGRGSKKDWTRYKTIFNFATDDEALEKSIRPTEGFEQAIQNDVLLISVHGTADTTVPYPDNAKLIVELWEKSGGRVKVFPKPGGRHHPHGLPDPAPLIELLAGARLGPPGRCHRWQY